MCSSKLMSQYLKSPCHSNNLKLILLISSLVWYFILFWLSSNYRSVEIVLIINDTDQRSCYANFVFNDANIDLKLKYMENDEQLENSNGQNIFFHLTNCIYDGIVGLSPR